MMTWGIWILVLISAGNFFCLYEIYQIKKEEREDQREDRRIK